MVVGVLSEPLAPWTSLSVGAGEQAATTSAREAMEAAKTARVARPREFEEVVFI
jgi:hypothetical protein